jgi:hypothetical protein
MIHYTEIANATLGQLTDELAGAGWDSTQTEIGDARGAVARLLHETAGPFDLIDSETNEVLRRATVDEAAESAAAGTEGHFLVDGCRCYVAP